ncbi:hypothetical protein BJ742DRAFT_340036 [Cladochytrium replicatum]|nr:hypothetical protein BJ742DRAFT_340036 [Cladochytrium replicatum]
MPNNERTSESLSDGDGVDLQSPSVQASNTSITSTVRNQSLGVSSAEPHTINSVNELPPSYDVSQAHVESMAANVIVTEDPPAKGLSKLLQSKKGRITIIMLAILLLIAAALTIALTVTKKSQEASIPVENLDVKLDFSYRVTAALATGKSRPIVGGSDYVVLLLDNVSSLGGASALLTISANDTWLQKIDAGVTISNIARDASNPIILALNMTQNILRVCYIPVEFQFRNKRSWACPVNLSNITSSSFKYPIVESSMFVAAAYYKIYVALADSAGVTWIYRIQLVGFILDGSSSIAASSRGTFRFAQSSGHVNWDSIDFSPTIMMLPSAPAQSIYDAYAFLNPYNLSLVLPVRRPQDSNSDSTFVGLPYRGSVSTFGTLGMVIGEKSTARPAAYLFPTDGSFLFGRISPLAIPTDVLVHYWSVIMSTNEILTEWEIEALTGPSSSISVTSARNSSTAPSPKFYGTIKTDFEVHSLESNVHVQRRSFYALGVLSSGEVVLARYSIYEKP